MVRVNGYRPLFTKNVNTIFDYNYNTAFVPAGFSNPTSGLLIRNQFVNSSYQSGVSPSVMSFSPLPVPTDVNDIVPERLTEGSVVFSPATQDENFGTEDPRIVYRDRDGLYYLLYSAVKATYFDENSGYDGEKENNITFRYDVKNRGKNKKRVGNYYLNCTLSMAITPTPDDPSSWIRLGPVVPQMKWSKSGSLLIRDEVEGPHYLFFGDSAIVDGIQMAISNDLLSFNMNVSDVWLPTRDGYFDDEIVEAGPMPLPLSDGNYLFLYNSACYAESMCAGYHIGYAILDKKDPSKIVQRCNEPLFTALLPWERDGLTPNVVFVEGWLPFGENQFLAFYGAADTTIGTALITVKKLT